MTRAQRMLAEQIKGVLRGYHLRGVTISSLQVVKELRARGVTTDNTTVDRLRSAVKNEL